MRRTLPLLAVLAFCGTGLAYGLPAASGTAEIVAPAEYVLDTTDEPLEPVNRSGMYRPAPQPATAAPETSTTPPPVVTTEPAPGVVVVEAPAPAAVTPQPVPVTEPVEAPAEPVLTEQQPDEVVGRVIDAPEGPCVVIDADLTVACEVAP